MRCCTIWKEETNARPNVLNEGRVRSIGKFVLLFLRPSNIEYLFLGLAAFVFVIFSHSPTMLFQPRRLSGLLFLVSTTILTFANIASAQVSTAYPTTTSAAASTPSPLPTSSSFYLVVADTGTPFDGDYLYIGYAFAGDGLNVALFGKEPQLADGSVFHLSNGSYGSLINNPASTVATYYDLYGGLLFETLVPGYPSETPVTCELADAVILCQNTDYSTFYTYPSTVEDGGTTTPYLELGPLPIPDGAIEIKLLPVPVD